MNNVMNRKSKPNNKKHEYIYLTVFVLIWFLLIVKCKYGFGSNDEVMYFSFPFRYCTGDYPFKDEWMVQLLSGIVEVPIMFVYRLFTKSTDGIILAFRYIFTLVWGLCSLFIYKRLKTINEIGAMISSVFILIYVPLNISTFSYNSMGLMSLLMSLVLLITVGKNKKVDYFVSGFLYSISVLCHPYVAILFFIQLIYVYLIKKDKKNLFIYFIFGVIIDALIVLIYLIINVPVSTIISAIPNILDFPEGVPENIFEKYIVLSPLNYIIVILNSSLHYYLLIVVVFYSIIIIDKRRIEHLSFYICACLLIVLIELFALMIPNGYYDIDDIMFVMLLLSLPVILLRNKKNLNVCTKLFVPGITYSLLKNISSNTGTSAINSALTISVIAIIIMIVQLVYEDIRVFNLRKIVLVFFIIVISLQIYNRFSYVYPFNPIIENNIKIDSGSERGLLVNESRYNKHQEYYDEIKSLNIDKKKVLFLSKHTWLNFFTTPIGIPSYSIYLSTNPERLLKYYENNVKKVPDVIFIDNEYNHIYYDVGIELARKLGLKITTTERGNIYCYK